MYLDDENEIKDRLEKLVWRQVDLFEELGLDLQAGCPKVDTAEWAKLKEITNDILQLELEAQELIFNKELPVFTAHYCQSINKVIDDMPVCEDEIPF